MRVELTYCILHYNKLKKLKKTISYIEKYTPIPYQVYIWNNGYMNSEIARYFKKLERKPEFKIWYCQVNLGCPAARGKLVFKTDTKYIFTIDDDMYIQEDTIPIALKLFTKHKKLGAISFPLFNPEDRLQSTSGILIDITDNILKTSKIPLQNGGIKIVDGLPGGAMLFRKQLKKFFRWDPNYKIGLEDLDKSLQIYFNNNELKQCVSFESKLIHDQTTWKENPSYLKVRRDYHELRRSYLYFVRKWGLRLPMVEHLLFKYIYAIPSREITMILNYGIRKLFKSSI